MHLVRKNKVHGDVQNPLQIPLKVGFAPRPPGVSCHFAESHVHKPLRGLKNRCNAEAENVAFVRGLERPCYLVFVFHHSNIF